MVLYREGKGREGKGRQGGRKEGKEGKEGEGRRRTAKAGRQGIGGKRFIRVERFPPRGGGVERWRGGEPRQTLQQSEALWAGLR